MNSRLESLDVLRGIAIASMIMVNMPGSWSHIFSPLRHAQWHGMTPTDIIFPLFLFVSGAAMYLSYRRHHSDKVESQQSSLTLYREFIRLVKRCSIIFLIGLALNAFPFNEAFTDLRILGVLQRIALAYFIAGLLILLFKGRYVWGMSGGILVAYGMLYMLFPEASRYTLEGNPVRMLDVVILGESHLWNGLGIAFDPEGLLSTFPAAVNVLLAYQLTKMIMAMEGIAERARFSVICGGILCIVGYGLSFVMPINKSLWTPSFVLMSTGCCLLLLALCIYVVDIRKMIPFSYFFKVYGLNPLFIYIVSWIWAECLYLVSVGQSNAYVSLYQSLLFFPEKIASLTFALFHVLFFWGICWALYRKNIIIKI